MTTADASEAAEPEVRTTAGTVRGRRADGLSVFRGIPFAEPPVGDARFAAPRAARMWGGVREAFSFGPPPPQDVSTPWPSRRQAADAWLAETTAGDDWLTVNVWTPDPDPAARRPVMVWIYGGAYKHGFAGNPAYDAGRLAHEGDAVVVSFNYRVGIEGFAAIEGAPANRGLLDQVAALEWVRDNVAAFGGDPDRVTVFGQSAGAGSIAALLAMPCAAGLFRRAIAQSVPSLFHSRELADDVASTIAAELGLRPTVADLSMVDPRELPAAGGAVHAKARQHENRWGPVAYSELFAPVVDGEVLPMTPWEALAAGAGREVELISGHNRDEYRLFVVLSGQYGRVGDDEAAAALRALGPGPDGERAYREAFPDALAGELYELVHSDWLFRMPSLRLAEAQAAGGGRAYVYELAWATPGHGGIFGASHGIDGPLVFGTFEHHLGPVVLGAEPPTEAYALAARMRGSWTAFAATGDPGWTAYDNERRLVQVFDAEPAVAAYPEETSRRLWQEQTFAAFPLLGA
ncbi:MULTISPECIES: carboxylesterase/lipase family protein [unclassified Pseudofrankia]|uniref:carboxylesterase/lipase family protein n=1 Tax=unclassified Pseudofrankia TaxID=2994372 RepID=UPI0008DA3716|nr:MULTISPECIES: carboxylesterase family protein [unclassified Pseudofrankia]MDT3445799.1 carboxylesterase family protein [Pseudofrankia sp. BMG5.37]OHV57568.1 carboxylesterase [Pseudofrankia sp. BMG5.36]